MRDDTIELPPEITDRDDLTLCVDIAYVCGVPMLVGIDTTIRHRFCVPLKNRSNKQLFKALDIAIRPYNKAGYRIKEIHCDQEFKHMMDQVSDEMDIEMNPTTTGEHVHEAERHIRTLKGTNQMHLAQSTVQGMAQDHDQGSSEVEY